MEKKKQDLGYEDLFRKLNELEKQQVEIEKIGISREEQDNILAIIDCITEVEETPLIYYSTT